MNWVSSFDTKFDAVIAHTDAVEITPDVVAQMMMKGFTEAELLKFKAEGFRHSPTRNSVRLSGCGTEVAAQSWTRT